MLPDETAGTAEQLPADEPGPGETQLEYERRTGQAPAAGEQSPTGEPSAQQAPAQPSAAELRAQLEEAEAREAEQGGARQGAALGAKPGPPAGAAAAALGGTGPTLPEQLDRAAVGSLGTGAIEHEEQIEITHSEPVLAQGASGEAVQRLVKLLAAAGYASNSVVNAAPENSAGVLDQSVMSDVERFWNDHPEARESDELFYGREGDLRELRGTWVGPHTWQVLYNLATEPKAAG